jgi:hypothetical protein
MKHNKKRRERRADRDQEFVGVRSCGDVALGELDGKSAAPSKLVHEGLHLVQIVVERERERERGREREEERDRQTKRERVAQRHTVCIKFVPVLVALHVEPIKSRANDGVRVSGGGIIGNVVTQEHGRRTQQICNIRKKGRYSRSEQGADRVQRERQRSKTFSIIIGKIGIVRIDGVLDLVENTRENTDEDDREHELAN